MASKDANAEKAAALRQGSSKNASNPMAGNSDSMAKDRSATQKTSSPQIEKTTESTESHQDVVLADFLPLPEAMKDNLKKIEKLNQRLLVVLSQKKPHDPGVEMPGPEVFLGGAMGWAKLFANAPQKLLYHQAIYWADIFKNYNQARQALSGSLSDSDKKNDDKRFKNPLWNEHPYFVAIKENYLASVRAVKNTLSDIEIPDPVLKRRVDWFVQQITDMLAPTNFLGTNPDALERAIQTEGESLVRGLENLISDIERAGGDFVVSLTDDAAFSLGENVATTKGAVVRRHPLYELLQYAPTTPKVRRTPIVIFPPWINKYYVMDLRPDNSLIKYIVDQGYSLFVVSWKNPGPADSSVGLEDYVSAYLSVLDDITDCTGEKKVNAVGYCIAGTTLSLVLALLKARREDRIKSATFFTTLTDFSDQGEFTAFLQDDFVDGIEREVNRVGILSSTLMSRTFSFLRANDLVWGPAVRHYLMGEKPPAFDLLYWNGDGTNLPAKMVVDYLRNLCQNNLFAGKSMAILGHDLHLSNVDTPLFAVACETDHIAPAKQSWSGIAQMGSKDKTFIMSESGHIAGIINPPTKKKYGHYISDAGFDSGFENWRAQALFNQGSWWPRWIAWLEPRSGGMVAARDPGQGLDAAPGLYVRESARDAAMQK